MERKTVTINELKRLMQYRHGRGQSEPAGTSKLAKRRTVETNKMKRLMYNRSVRGAI